MNQFFRLMREAIDKAKENGRCYYVYEDTGGLKLSDTWQKDYLFQAYPGGRKILSIKGAEMAGFEK